VAALAGSNSLLIITSPARTLERALAREE